MRTNLRLFGTIILTTLFTLTISVMRAEAATFTVTNSNNSGAGSLRQAVLDTNAAPGSDTIVFDSPFGL